MKHTRPIIDYVEGENPWITYMKGIIYDKNKSINAATVGDPGSGKSWATLKMCHQIDPDFTVEGNWFFKAAPFMREINNYYNKSGKAKPGKIWVLDEAGVDLNNLNFMDDLNKGLNAFFQTARHRNYYFFATVPFMRFLSKGVRTLMTTQFTATGWNSKNRTILYPRVIQYNGAIDKFYNKMLLVRNKEKGTMTKCDKSLVPKPPIKLIREYEKRKKEFTGILFEGIANRLEHFEKKQIEKYTGKTLNPIMEDILKDLKDGMNIPKIEKKRDISHVTLRKYMALMRDRGVGIFPIQKGNSVVKYNIYDNRPEMEKGLK